MNAKIPPILMTLTLVFVSFSSFAQSWSDPDSRFDFGGGSHQRPGSKDRPMYPYDGPQHFSNSSDQVAYSWSFSGIDRNGCRSCMSYNPDFRCTPQTVGQRMRSPRPGTRDDDYTYTCQTGYGSRYPSDGPQYFANTYWGSAYTWRYVQTDTNSCRSCIPYDPYFQCNRRTVGQRMKSPQPRTRDNDYVYQCLQEN